MLPALTLAYLALPVLIFVAGWLRPPYPLAVGLPLIPAVVRQARRDVAEAGGDRPARSFAALAGLTGLVLQRPGDAPLDPGAPGPGVPIGRALGTPAAAGATWGRPPLVAALCVGSVTGLAELPGPPVPSPGGAPRSGVPAVTALQPPAVARQYLGRPDHAFFRHLARGPATPASP